MVLLLALMLTAPPATCEQLWPTVWKALDAKDLKGKPPFPTLPDGKERLGRAWVAECSRFDKETLECARGVQLEAQLALVRKLLEQERTPPAEIEKLLAKARAEWKITDCKEVDRAIDRAAHGVARDAGLE